MDQIGADLLDRGKKKEALKCGRLLWWRSCGWAMAGNEVAHNPSITAEAAGLGSSVPK